MRSLFDCEALFQEIFLKLKGGKANFKPFYNNQGDISFAKKISNQYIRGANLSIVTHNDRKEIEYDILDNEIFICHPSYYVSERFYFMDLFHELAHSTGKKNKLYRKSLFLYDNDSDQFLAEELIAELTATYLTFYCKLLDPYACRSHISYLKGYCPNSLNYKEFREIHEKAFQATKFIISGKRN